MLNEASIAYVKLGGVVPNPRLSLVHEGIELCRKEGVDFLLAVGGGSVIDSCKAIGYGVGYDGDVWDVYTCKTKPASCLPIGTILTIPAAGSEMSDSSVITNDNGDVKIGFSSNLCRCKFAIMDPTRTFTLPAWQTACGITDMMMHTMERYFESIGMPTNIHTLLGKEVSDAEIEKMADMASHGDTITLGALKVLKKSDIIAIYNMAK